MVAKRTKLVIKPSKTPLIFSYENLVLLIFIGLSASFCAYFRISVVELLIILLMVVVIISPVIVKLVKLSITTYVVSQESFIEETKWLAQRRKQINKQDVKNILLKQNLFQKYLDTGEIWISTDKGVNKFINIGDFKKNRQLIESITKDYPKQR